MKLKSISSENLNKETAYLLGVYLTDGSITHRSIPTNGCTFQLQVIDLDFAERTLCFLKKILPNCKGTISEHCYDPSPDSFNKNPCRKFCLGVGFTFWADFFESQTGKKHHIPFVIWDASLEIKRWFIAGVLDGDGWVSIATKGRTNRRFSIGVGKMENSWIWEFKQLLEEMGISVNKPDISMAHTNGKTIKTYSSPVVRLHFNVDSFINHGLFFTIDRKQQRIKTIIKERSETKCSTPEGVKI